MVNEVWLSRNPLFSPPEKCVYRMWSKRPKLRKFFDAQYWIASADSFLAEFCPHEFEEVTGFKLEPGEAVQVEWPISMKQIGERITTESAEVSHPSHPVDPKPSI